MSIYFKCCAVCGSINFWGLDEECHDCKNKEALPKNEMSRNERLLKMTTRPIYYYSKHKIDYYENISTQLYNTDEKWYDVFVNEELSKLETFNYDLYLEQEKKNEQYYLNQRRLGNSDVDKKAYIIRMQSNTPQQQNFSNLPKCPTCQSTNVSKIGSLERGVSVVALGLMSGKIGKTMKCNNCGYKW